MVVRSGRFGVHGHGGRGGCCYGGGVRRHAVQRRQRRRRLVAAAAVAVAAVPVHGLREQRFGFAEHFLQALGRVCNRTITL